MKFFPMMLTEYEHQQSSLTGPNPQKTIFGSKSTPPPPDFPVWSFSKKMSQSPEASLTNSEEKGAGKTGTYMEVLPPVKTFFGSVGDGIVV